MKQIYSKKRRLEIYKQMLIDIKTEEESREGSPLESLPVGFCLLLHGQFIKSDDLEHFPELMEWQPKKLAGSFWFPKKSINPRIKILKTIIKEMEEGKVNRTNRRM